jgi:signal transduction histidine kinase
LETDWNEAPATHRVVTYTTLPAAEYRFRVQSKDSRGGWSEPGLTLAIHVLPAWWNKWQFRTGWITFLVLLTWLVYRRRLHRMQREFEVRLEGRVEERTRIARELHDTLLQSVQGVMILFQAGRNLLPGRAEDAIRTLDRAISEGDQAIAEGRDAVQGLRAEPALGSNLEHLLTAAGKELAKSSSADGEPSAFQVTVEGARRPISPLLHDEVYKIAREMLRNAFHHAHASRIEAELAYGGQFFRLRIRDNGKGIDPKVLEAGAREGHWGLPGVHERAKRIGGRLKLWSELGAGTEAELTVPARIAYGPVHRREGLRLFRKRKVEPCPPGKK